MPENPIAIAAAHIPPRSKNSRYPAPFAGLVAGREKRALGDFFNLTNFGVNYTRLRPGAQSALLHRHSRQDELIYVLEGNPTLVTETAQTELSPGMCAGFKAGGTAHHLINNTAQDVIILEIGDRQAGDTGTYPQDDLKATLDDDGKWRFTHKDGSPY